MKDMFLLTPKILYTQTLLTTASSYIINPNPDKFPRLRDLIIICVHLMIITVREADIILDACLPPCDVDVDIDMDMHA